MKTLLNIPISSFNVYAAKPRCHSIELCRTATFLFRYRDAEEYDARRQPFVEKFKGYCRSEN